MAEIFDAAVVVVLFSFSLATKSFDSSACLSVFARMEVMVADFFAV